MPAPRPLDRRTKLILIALLVALIGLTLHRYLLAPPVGPYLVFSGPTMGTTFDVKVASEDLGPEAQRRVGAAIQRSLERTSSLMSTWDPESEISRFNASRSTQPFALSAETLAVLQASQQVSELSGGALDVTVGPLVKAWGFGPGDPLAAPPRAPDAEALSELRERVGFDRLTVDAAAMTVAKSHPLTELDLSAVAKGFGVDQVARTLEQLGFESYLVEVGGELRASGRKLDGEPWRVAIEQPGAALRSIHRVIVLEGGAMATSGDYRNYYEEDGVRISHTIDPRSGRPIRHRLASVTVLHEEALWADALATALTVLGPQEGYAVALREGLAAYFMVRTGPGEFDGRATPAFAPLLEDVDEERERQQGRKE